MFGCDLDGCVANWLEGVELIRPDLQLDKNRYDLGLCLADYRDVVDEMIDRGDYARLSVYPGVIQALLGMGDVVYVTRRRSGQPDVHRDYAIQAQTFWWLKAKGFPHPKSIVYTQDKQAWCKQAKPKFFVDDYLQDCKKIQEVTMCYCLNRPWNQGEFPNRVNTLAEIP